MIKIIYINGSQTDWFDATSMTDFSSVAALLVKQDGKVRLSSVEEVIQLSESFLHEA